jgi:hypothetical protein
VNMHLKAFVGLANQPAPEYPSEIITQGRAFDAYFVFQPRHRTLGLRLPSCKLGHQNSLLTLLRRIRKFGQDAGCYRLKFTTGDPDLGAGN